MTMTHLVGLMFLLLLVASPAAGAMRDAASCSQADILAAVADSANGDTIRVPKGTCVWTSGVTINKGITLQGAGIGQTIIVDSRVRVGGVGNLLTAVIPQGSTVLFRVTGFTFQGDGIQSDTFDGMLVVDGCSINAANLRIDHNRFDSIANINIKPSGAVWGVIDHNDVITLRTNSEFVNSNVLTWPRNGSACSGGWGDGSWAYPLTPGGMEALYLEDNTITPKYPGDLGVLIDSNAGSRAVLRHNTFLHATIGSHGTDSGQRYRGSRWIEAYDNTFTFDPAAAVDMVAWYRGGSGVFFSNKIYATLQNGLNWVLKHHNYRDDYNAAIWGACDGTRQWDGNAPGEAGYRCIDQPGAGTSVDWQDVYDASTLGRAQNTSEPIYVWGNTINDAPNNCGSQPWSCGDDGHVVAGRDVLYGTPRPGYVAFTYPHPLVGGSEASPLPPTNVTILTSSAPTPPLEATVTPAATVLSAGVPTTQPTSKSTVAQPAAATPLSVQAPLSSAAATSPRPTDVRPTAATFPAASVTSPQGVMAQPNPATASRREAALSPTSTSIPPAATETGTIDPMRPESSPHRVAAIPLSATAMRPTAMTPGPPAAAGTTPQILLGSPGSRRNRALPVTVTSEIQLAHVKVFIDDKLVLTLATRAMKLSFSQLLPNRKAVTVSIEATDSGGNRARQRVAIPAASDAQSLAGDGRSRPPKPLTKD